MNLDELIKISNIKLIQAKENKNNEDILLYEKILKLFSDRPTIFFEIDMESALRILSKILPDENVLDIYTELISPENFKKLRDKFKI